MKKIILLFVCVGLLVGCPSVTDPFDGDTDLFEGELIANFDLAYAMSIGYSISRVQIIITHQTSGVTVSRDLTINQELERATGIFTQLRIGFWDAEAVLFEGDTEIGRGEGTFEVIEGDRATLTIEMILSTGEALITVNWRNIVPGEFLETGSMPSSRRDQTVTLLEDGKVLLIGSGSPLLYDPATEQFSETGANISSFHTYSTATRLLDGHVLVVGGADAPTTAEIYEPVTGEFSITGSLVAEHVYHTAVLLEDGRVLIIGGRDVAVDTSQATCEIYDPAAGTFALTDSLKNDRYGHESALLSDGTVIVLGGGQTTTPGSGITLYSAEIFDPLSETWRELAQTIPVSERAFSSILLDDGNLLVFMDMGIVRYDPSSEAFTYIGDTLSRHGGGTATLLLSGVILISGGYVEIGPVTTAAAEYYDPITDAFTLVPDMNFSRQQHAAIRLDSGAVLVVGGYSSEISADLSAAELYHP